MMIEVRLYWQTPEGGQERSLTGSRLRIGSSEDADWRIQADGIQERHATVYREGEQVLVVDESNGHTLVNNQPVSPAGRRLADGDEIKLGKQTLLRIRLLRTERIAGRSFAERTPAPQPQRLKTGRSAWGKPVGLALLGLVFVFGGTALIRTWVEKDRKPKIRQTPPVTDSSPIGLENPTLTESPTPQSSAAPPKTYLEMNETEKLAFVRRKAEIISKAISKSPTPYEFSDGSLAFIEKYVRQYAERIKSKCIETPAQTPCLPLEALGGMKGCLWGENLASLLSRARCFAPTIIRAFNDSNHRSPVEIGLYIAMIESEYHTRIGSNAGAKGMFQFLPSTAKFYGVVNEDELYDPQLMAVACAKYIRHRLGQFGTDKMSVTLAIAGYNRGPGSVEKDVAIVLNQKDTDAVLAQNKGERDFWSLVESKSLLDKYFNGENIKYVPKFFAAAIVGENPRSFGVEMDPLSSYSSP